MAFHLPGRCLPPTTPLQQGWTLSPAGLPGGSLTWAHLRPWSFGSYAEMLNVEAPHSPGLRFHLGLKLGAGTPLTNCFPAIVSEGKLAT